MLEQVKERSLDQVFGLQRPVQGLVGVGQSLSQTVGGTAQGGQFPSLCRRVQVGCVVG